MEHVVRVGPAGWSYADWKGIVYPKDAKTKFDELAYLAKYFNVIEINSTFYRPPSEKASRSWVRRVAFNNKFKFTAKLYEVFTHKRDQATSEDEKNYRSGIDPLAQAGNLGAILIQFPWSFKNTPEDRQYLDSLTRRFRDYPLVVEVRHASWNAPEVYESFAEQGVGFCNIDQPLFSRSIKPSALATSGVGYVRLHGRNYQSWFAEFSDDARSRAERYNYLYSREELHPWVDKIRTVASQSLETYVITNNHFQGKGIVNALELEHELTGRKPAGPPGLFDAYPRLSDSAIPE
jgi:uncharacterized protein YecE (DUF72 family)